ncbi:phage tail tip lysozyme [Bosea sp. UNC402CLCol]|uniref:phage tail tip lysozyme n=1 Tax=Bosea sp. UNC402CLCol TaxID=1510531 RepID=UPI000571D9ED|nr:phage tail tip lysozyme [Bosea sp. UNC402CLCol]
MADTIKEFLVGIGYKIDGGSEAKFLNSVGAATKAVIKMNVTLLGIATGIGAVVTKIAAGFDEIYFTAQRAGASVQNIKGLSYAVSQLGGSYQGALASIESFAQKMRSNPGYESLVKSLGVATRENGRLRETTAIVQDLAKALSKKPQYVALQYLEALGIDERTYNAIKSGDLTRFMDEYAAKARALGVDQKQAADIGNQLTQAWRSLGATAELIGAKLEQTLGRSLASFVKDVDDFLIRNADKIVTFFDEAGKAAAWLAAAFQKLVQALTPAWEAFDKIAQSLTGQSGLQVALEAFAVWLVGSWLLRILGAFTAIGAGWGAMLLKLGINPLTLGAAGALALSTSPANGGEDQEIARRRANGTWGKTPNDGTPGSAPQITDKRNWWQRTMPKFMGGQDAPSGGGGRGDSNAPIRGSTFTQKAPGIINRLMADFGFTREQAAGIVGNLGHESGGLNELQERNPTSGRGGYGWAQWTGPRRRAFEAWAAEKGLDPASDEANYGFLRHELRTSHKGAVSAVKRAGSVEDATVAFENTFEQAGIKNYPSRNKWAQRALRAAERAAAAQAEAGTIPAYTPFSRLNAGSMAAVQSNAALIGSGIQPSGSPLVPPAANNNTNVDMAQKTEITILGGSDPSATASAVADAQNGVNGRMLRNMTGAVR